MANRHYPKQIFWVGVVTNLVRGLPWLFLVLIIFTVRVFVPGIPAIIPLGLAAFWIIQAFITQFKYRKIAVSKHPDEATNAIFDRLFGKLDESGDEPENPNK